MILRRLEIRVLTLAGEPIEGAVVSASQNGKTSHAEYSPPRKLYIVKELAPGFYEVEVSHESCAPQKRRVQVDFKPVRITFVLAGPDVPQIPLGRGVAPYPWDAKTVGVAVKSESRSKAEGDPGVSDLVQQFKLTRLPSSQASGPDALSQEYFSFERASAEDDQSLQELRQRHHVSAVGPLLVEEGTSPRILTHQLFVRFIPRATSREIDHLLDELGLRKIRRLEFSPGLFLVEASDSIGFEIVDVAKRLLESRLVDYAEPRVVDLPAQDGTNPSFLWPGAWDRHQANVELAWQKLGGTPGDPDVILAVIDNGVPSTNGIPNHADFKGNVSSGEPKVFRLFDFNTMTSDIRQPDPHGIFCSGIAAGLSLGAAPNCRMILAVPPGDSVLRLDMMRWAAGLPIPHQLPQQFPVALSTGAAIFSISVAFQTAPLLAENENELYAFLARRGRKGKGCMVCVAAGNNAQHTAVSRPTGISEFVFACAATTLQQNGLEARALYSGFGDVEWCAPSSSNRSGGKHNPPQAFSTWTTDLNGQGALPSAPVISARLIQNASPRATEIFVDTIEGFIPTMHLLLEQPGHVRAEAVEIVGIPSGHRIPVRELSYEHLKDAEVTAGLQLVGHVAHQDAMSNQPVLQVSLFPALSLNDVLTAGASIVLWNGSSTTDPKRCEILSMTPFPDRVELTLTKDLDRLHRIGTRVYLSHQNHTHTFGGTSSATSLCAGIAALVLSANPDLTWVEARDILRSTAEQVDPQDKDWLDENGELTSISHRPPFFNEKYGYGRLNAAKAVEEALKYEFPRDLRIRSSLTDQGDAPVPNPDDSPDIWVRDQDPENDPGAQPLAFELPGPHQPIHYGRDHWVYARVTNRGTKAGLDAWVRFYVASGPKTTYEFPEDWQGLNGEGNTSAVEWQEGTYFIDEVAITGVPPGESLVVRVHWPSQLLPPPGTAGTPWQTALLVEITPQDGPLRGTRPGENNNLAQKRIEILGEPPT